jgi:1-acyl-sn-glycerol-3-phosphate acyltransferase
MPALYSQSSTRQSNTWDDIEENQKALNQHFDPAYSKSVVKNVIGPINDRYFKCEFVGFDQLPQRNNPKRPLLYVSNHSGMAFPWDGMVFSSIMLKRENYNFRKAVRTLAAPVLSQSNLMNPFIIENFWKINGAIDARFKNFAIMMRQRDFNILIYPEGVAGIGKGFNRKYQLQRFATSFVRMALKYRTDIIPFATVNGEYINPYVYSWPWLNKLSQKIGIPYIPMGLHTILLLLFPWMFYFALPARLTYVLGKRIKPYELVDKPFEELTEDDIKNVRDQVKHQMQEELNQAVKKFGNKKYSSGKIVGNSIRNMLTLNYYCPSGWPLLFHEHHRLYTKHQGQEFTMNISFWSGLKYLIRNPLTLAFYIPVLGWIPLLIKGYGGHRIQK